MFSKADVHIIMEGANNYRPNDAVRGEVLVTAKKDFTLNDLQFLFSGELAITIRERIVEVQKNYTSVRTNDPRRRQTTIITHYDKHPLFINSIDLGVGKDPVNMNKGDSRRFGFCIFFPQFVECRRCRNGTRLPSTNFTTSALVDYLNCEVSVVYSLTATVEPDSTFGKGQASQFLNFTQIGDENLLFKSDRALSYKSEQVWKGKMKKFLDLNYDEYGYYYRKYDVEGSIENIKCIPNPLVESHNHSRSVRKFFNKSYKKEHYSKLVGDVVLELEITVNKRVINDTDDVRDCFSLLLRSKVAKLQPDYLLHSKKSSQLGLFSLRSTTIVLVRNYAIATDSQRRTFEQRTTIFHKRYGHELTFDIVDFTPNYRHPSLLEWNIPMKELLFPEKIMCLSNKPNFLSGCGILDMSHQLSVTLALAENLEESPKTIEFLIDIKMM